MKRYLRIIIVLLLGLLIPCLTGVLVAQEEETEYSWGTVSSISSDQIIVTEYDSENDKDVDITYTVEPDVQLSGVEKLEDIKVGDSLEIDYIVRGDKKIIKVLAVEKQPREEEQEEYIPLPTYEEEPEYLPGETEY